MSFIRLRRQLIANVTGQGAPFVAIEDYYDTVKRTTYSQQQDSQVNNPSELPLDTPIDSYQYRPGKSMNVLYAGEGKVKTQRGATTSLNNVAAVLGLLPAYTSNPGRADACVDVTGSLGQPPYRVTVTGASGPALGYSRQQTSPDELHPVRFDNLAEGTYSVAVVDALGHPDVAMLTVTAGIGYGRAKLIYERAAPTIRTLTYQWRYNERDVYRYEYDPKGSLSTYVAPYGTLLDGYLLNATTWRRVYSRGQAPVNGAPLSDLVYFEDTAVGVISELTLDNLIVFDPDTIAEQNGGALLEMRGGVGALSFSLAGTSFDGLPVQQGPNSTGSFDGLAAGSYTVTVTDAANGSVTVPLELKNRYGLRYELVHDDLDSVPLRLELWRRGYTGTVDEICGQDTPVVLVSDGLNSSIGGYGDVPPAVGTSAELSLLVPSDLFEDLARANEPDRLYRCDVYRNGQLEFRGYVQPDVFEVPLLSGLQPLSLTATDGLAALKDTYMTGHLGQRLVGHRPWLNTLVHCLSRCEIALPVRLFTNRRDSTMATVDAPEAFATTNRTGYWEEDKNEPELQRTVLEAISQALGGTLVQRQGAWEVRSALEAALPATGRAYLPAGTAAGALTVAAPTFTVRPPARGQRHWLEANQNQQQRPGWKSLVGTTDLGWLKNAYVPGKVFSDKYSWLDNAQQLRAVNGWQPAPGQSFPIVLSRVGAKGSDYTTKWPRSRAYSVRQAGEYLLGPALPLAPGTEAVPATLQFTARFAPAEYFTDSSGNQVAAPTNASKGVLPYEILVDGQSAGVQLAEFDLATSATAKTQVVSADLLVLPSGSERAQIRLYSWYAANQNAYDNATRVPLPGSAGPAPSYTKGEAVRYDRGSYNGRLFVARNDTGAIAASAFFDTGTWQTYFAEITATNNGLGEFYLSEVGVQLTPQNATWEGEDNFRADGPAGNVRPTEALEVYHADVPLAAGLFGGNLYAFGKAVGMIDGTMTTSWKRPLDKLGSPLFEADVLDLLALRANPSKLLTGAIRHDHSAPFHLLDSVDLPFDKVGNRRFWVAAWRWDMKAAHIEVSLVEIGAGAGTPNPATMLPAGGRVTHELYQYLPGLYTPHPRGVHGGGIRVRHL
jgi:hypothetical protein